MPFAFRLLAFQNELEIEQRIAVTAMVIKRKKRQGASLRTPIH
jgi:hypothetical protein